MKIKKLASVLGIGLAMTTGIANAQGEIFHSFEDDDLDFLLRNNNFTDPVVSSTQFQVGDILVSAFEIPTYTVNGVNAIPAGQELTGVAAVQITNVIDVNPGTAALEAGSTIVFGAAPLDGILTANGINLAMPLGANAAVAMFFNGTSGAGGDLDLQIGKANGTPPGNPNCTGLADCLTQATLGTKFQVDGFLGDPDEFWTSTIVVNGGADPATVLGSSNDAIVAVFNAALSNIYHQGVTEAGEEVALRDIATGNYCGLNAVAADGCAQFTLSGTVTGGQGIPAGHGAFAHSDFDGGKYTIPEPTSLVLLGAGLLGFGASSRRKISA